MDLFMLGLLQKMSRGGGKSVSHSSSYTINNTVDYPLVGLNLYGKSTQDGVPTPEAPIDIVSVGDNGFDIISKDDTHFNLLSVRDSGGEIITKQPVSTAVKAGESAAFTVAASGDGLTYLWQWSIDSGTTWQNTSNKTASYKVTVKQIYNGYKYRCVVTDANGNSEISNTGTLYVFSDDCEVKMEIIVTDALPLCGIPVDSGGNYTDSNGQQWFCDELIYNADGTGTIIKRCKKMTLTSKEIRLMVEYPSLGNYFITTIVADTASSLRPISNIFVGVSLGYANNTENRKYFRCFIMDNGAIILRNSVTENDKFPTLESMQNFVDSNDAYIVYPLAEPQEIELTSEEMTALRQLQTYNGMTNISNSDNANMDVKYCTDKSLSECVLPIAMGLQKQIDELQVYVQKQIDEIEAGILTPGTLVIPGFYAETIIGPIITEGDE